MVSRIRCSLLRAAILLSLLALTADAAVYKNKVTGETLRGTLTTQRVNGKNIFNMDDGRTKYVNPDDLELAEADKPAVAPTGATPAPSAAPAVAPAQPADKDSKVTLYMEIPIVGILGEDVLPEGVEHCLRYCSQNPNIKHVVFRINSPGGYIDAGDEIRDIIKRYAGRFQFHALIEKAASAAIWVVFSCDTIHMADGAIAGGAVPYHRRSSGSAEVDAKLQSLCAAQMAALASAKGYPPAIARAMIIQACEVYAWKQDGKVLISEAVPTGIPDKDMIVRDTAQTVLTLTKEQAVEIGLAKPLAGGPDALGTCLGLPGWRKLSNYTEIEMQRTKRNQEKAVAELKAACKSNIARTNAEIDYINGNVAEAQANDPGRFTYYYDPETGMLTPDSVMLWRTQTQRTIAAWRRVRDGLVELLALDERAEQLGMQPGSHRSNMAYLYTRAQREIDRLSAGRP